MSLFELVVISISLAMDAFTVSMMYGISMPKGKETQRRKNDKSTILFKSISE